ncbi:unnamed protein product [Symbiodinium sp. CCMP2592]|nr:unnamed protein product [Symbiodinium sp. CCMP2592]
MATPVTGSPVQLQAIREVEGPALELVARIAPRHPLFGVAAAMALVAALGVLVAFIILQARAGGGFFSRKPRCKIWESASVLQCSYPSSLCGLFEMPLPPISVAFAEDSELGEPTKPVFAVECAADPAAKQDASAVAAETPEAGGEDSGKDLPDGTRTSDAPPAPEAANVTAQAEKAADDGEEAEQAEAEEEEAEEATGKRKRRQGLRARVLAELKSTSPCDLKTRLESELIEQDAVIAVAKEVEAGKQKLVDEALAEVEHLSQAVKEASQHEETALGLAKELRKRKKEAAKECSERQKEVQHHEDLLFLLGFEVERRRKLKEAEASMESEKDAKRQKILELLQVAEDAKKAQDEMRQREKEARQAVRQLEKEQKQLQLGPFGRRQVAARKAKATKCTEDSEDPKEAASETSAPVVDLLVPVKREGALTPFPTHPRTEENVVISIEDSQ